jgi:hypothetical protein
LTKGAAVGACSGWMPKQKPERRPDSVPVSTGFYHRYIYICIYVYMYMYIYMYIELFHVVSICFHLSGKHQVPSDSLLVWTHKLWRLAPIWYVSFFTFWLSCDGLWWLFALD